MYIDDEVLEGAGKFCELDLRLVALVVFELPSLLTHVDVCFYHPKYS